MTNDNISHYHAANSLADMAYAIHALFHHAVARLAQNPRIGLLAVSQLLKVERHTLERAFRAVAGRSFRQFQSQVLLQKALDLLASEPALSIKEVAFRLGYNPPQAFARFLKAATGYCPCQLRCALVGFAATTAGPTLASDRATDHTCLSIPALRVGNNPGAS